MISKKDAPRNINGNDALMLIQKRDAPVFIRMPKALKDQLERERKQSDLNIGLIDYIILKLAKKLA